MSDKDVVNIISKYKDLANSRKLIVKDIFAGAKLLTETVSDRISSCYEAIRTTEKNLNSKDPLLGDKVRELNLLKLEVPKKFAITKDQMYLLNEVLNNMLSVNSSDAVESSRD